MCFWFCFCIRRCSLTSIFHFLFFSRRFSTILLIKHLFLLQSSEAPRSVLRKRCSPVNLLHIFRIPFYKNNFKWLLLKITYPKIFVRYEIFITATYPKMFVRHEIFITAYFVTFSLPNILNISCRHPCTTSRPPF